MNDENDDRFQQMRNLDESDGHNLPVITSRPPMHHPVGAQPVAKPRNVTAILAQIKALAAAAGDAWYYRWPVNSGGGQKWIEGASIKLANDLARTYGNCKVDVWVEDADIHWNFYATFIDYETGFEMTRPFQQRKGQKSIKTDADRQRDIAFQIGASKAIRNVIVNSLQTYADYGLEQARKSLIEDIGKNLPGSRTRLLEVLWESKIEATRVERAIGRKVNEMLAPDIARVLAMLKTIDDGMATVDETFPHETVANPLGAQPAPPEEIEHIPGDRFYREPEPRQEPTGEVSRAGPPRQRAPKKDAQAAAPRAPEGPKGDGAKRQEDLAERELREEVEDREREQAKQSKADRLARAEQEGREAATSRPLFSSSAPPAATHSAGAQSAPAAAIVGTSSTAPNAVLREQQTMAAMSAGSKSIGWPDEAIDYISNFKGSPGNLLDWWRNNRANRALLTMEQQTRVSHIYSAKINELGGLED